MKYIDKDNIEKFSNSFNKLVEIFSPFYKKPFHGNNYNMPSFEMLEYYPDPIFVLDFTIMGYLYINKSVKSLDLDVKKVLANNVSYSLNLILEHEKEILLKEVFPTLFKYAELYMENNRFPDFKSSYCSHVRLKTGEYHWFAHEISILGVDSVTGHVIGLKQLRDINHIKKDNDLDFSIFEKDQYGIFRILEKKSFDFLTNENLNGENLIEEDSFCFSKREIEVLAYIKKGFSSKEIADALIVSGHTVNNHRKNILRKSNGKNIMEIIQMMSCRKII